MLPPSFELALERFCDDRGLALQHRISTELGDVAERISAVGRVGGMAGWETRVVWSALEVYVANVADDGISLLTTVFTGDPPLEAIEATRRVLMRRVQSEIKRRAEYLGHRSDQPPMMKKIFDQQGKQFAERSSGILERQLLPIEVRCQLRIAKPAEVKLASSTTRRRADVFICHASEDKDAVARPMAAALKSAGYSVWLDEYAMKVGDRLFEALDKGIQSSRFGIVILSPIFFTKKWTRRELNALAVLEDEEDRTVILPVRYNLSVKELKAHSLFLGSVVSVDWAVGAAAVIEEIKRAIGEPLSTASTNEI